MLVPQFPLGSVLVPTMVLPLHIFEPRYREFARDLEASSDPTFGVVLIERGHEVGGGEQRSSVGTLAKVVEAEEFPDGRWALVGVGTERFKVIEWHEDRPYPMATIELWPDEPAGPDADDLLATTISEFGRTWATASEAGHNVGPLPTIDPDPSTGSMQLISVSPLGSFDQQRLLEIPGPDERLEALRRLLAEAREMFELQIHND